MQFTYRSIKCTNICSLPTICIWHSYVNDVPCFFFFFFSACVYVHVCLCVLFVSLSLCFFSPVLPPLLPFSLYRQTKRDAENLDSYFPFWKKKQKPRDTPVLFSLPLAWRLKGRLDKCHSCSIAVPLISTRSPFNSREGKALSLPQAA